MGARLPIASGATLVGKAINNTSLHFFTAEWAHWIHVEPRCYASSMETVLTIAWCDGWGFFCVIFHADTAVGLFSCELAKARPRCSYPGVQQIGHTKADCRKHGMALSQIVEYSLRFGVVRNIDKLRYDRAGVDSRGIPKIAEPKECTEGLFFFKFGRRSHQFYAQVEKAI